ncbi:hypothetical protein TWF481_008315 [Arthrobotrys musiformis]|uniref:Transcriptional coactivator p15 (PC4) C-terminal domain-containing protein n=1 Tax=Arthrobotrys musiformis TaxID=47236 RepID=A0AAV9W6X3_9PEZI
MPPKQFNKFSKKPYVKKTFTKRTYNNDNNNDDESSSKRFKSSNVASSSSAAASKPPDGARHVDEEGNFYWELGKDRRATVSEFRGNVLVSIREYYEKDGKYFPGKKGISMSLEQFNQLIRVLPALEEAIGQKSSAGVVRPIYTTSAKHDAPGLKPKQEIASEDDQDDGEEEEAENKIELNIPKEEDEDEDEAKTSDIEEKPPKKSSTKNSKARDNKPLKSKKKKVPDSEDEDDEDDFVEEEEEDSEEL